MAKNLKTLKELMEELNEAGDELGGTSAEVPVKQPKPVAAGLPDDDEPEEEHLKDHAPDGKGHYSPDDLREIIDYVYDILDKEKEDSGAGEDDEDGKKGTSDVGEVGLDLIYEYADLLPETVINQIVDDLKDTFEIEDTMLESIISEGASSFFTKSNKGPAAKAAAAIMTGTYKKNKGKIKKRNSNWRNSDIGKKIAALHTKIWKNAGKMKGKRAVAGEPKPEGK